MKIRGYVNADWERLCAIHDAARKDELAAAELSAAFLNLEATAESEGLFGGEVLVCEVNDGVNGFVAFAAGELTWLYVDPAAYRQGIGRQLPRAAIDRCRRRMSTEVLVGNERALSLYLSEGFTTVSGVMAYDVTDRRAPELVRCLNTRRFDLPPRDLANDTGAEGFVFIDADDSPNRRPLLLIGNEVCQTLTEVEVRRVVSKRPGQT